MSDVSCVLDGAVSCGGLFPLLQRREGLAIVLFCMGCRMDIKAQTSACLIE